MSADMALLEPVRARDVGCIRRLAPVSCVIEHLRRDLGVADEVVRGRFTCVGTTLALGVEPDWLHATLPVDKEWRVEWVKFPFALDLAHAYATTGDARYLTAWYRLLGSWMVQVPPGHGPTEVVARRLQHWIYSWQRLERSPGWRGLEVSFQSTLERYLRDETRSVREQLSAERNHRTLELYALLVSALALGEADVTRPLARFALDELHRNALADIRPDGVHREQSTHYHCIALRSYLGALDNARRFGLPVAASFGWQVQRACEFAMHVHRPDGRVPACSDADVEDYRDVLALGARLFGRADLQWVASGGRTGRPPAVRNMSFADGGYHVQRSGWGDGGQSMTHEAFLLFDCGPLGDGGHGHYDALAVDVSAGGRPLLVDAGRFTYAEDPPNWRRWFKSTAAHNTVTVDGLDQTPYRRRRPKGAVASARLVARVRAPRLDLLVGDVRSPAYDAVHTRSVLFVADEYWLIADHLGAPTPHEYDLRWHFAPGAAEHLVVSEAEDATTVRTDAVTLLIAPSRASALQSGWVSPRYGEKHEAPIISTRQCGCRASFLTAIVPAAAPQRGAERRSDVTPRLRVRRLGPHAWARTTVQVEGVGPRGTDTDLVTWSLTVEDIALGGFRGRARVAFTRVDASGRAVELGVAGFEGGCWDPGDDVHAAEREHQPTWLGWTREARS